VKTAAATGQDWRVAHNDARGSRYRHGSTVLEPAVLWWWTRLVDPLGVFRVLWEMTVCFGWALVRAVAAAGLWPLLTEFTCGELQRVRAAAGLWLLLTEFTCGELLQFILDGRSGVFLGVSLVGWCIPFGG
jgi:hypothetical protein